MHAPLPPPDSVTGRSDLVTDWKRSREGNSPEGLSRVDPREGTESRKGQEVNR